MECNFFVGQKALDTFERFVMPEPNSGCWLWIGATNNKGYGLLQVHGEFRAYAHRFAYAAFVGPLGGLNVCHRCDIPPCCNPEHLFLGTQRDNMRDARAKGRHACITAREAYLRGEDIAVSKLTPETVREILALRGVRGQRKIAAQYGVSKNTIALIHRGRTWRHISAPIFKGETVKVST